MPLNPNIPLQAQAASIEPLQRSFRLGMQAPMQMEQAQKQREAQDLAMQQAKRADYIQKAQQAYSLLGDMSPQMTNVQYANAVNTLREAGFPMDADDDEYRPDNVDAIVNLLNQGKRLSLAGGAAGGYTDVREINGQLVGINKETGRAEVIPATASVISGLQEKKLVEQKEKERKIGTEDFEKVSSLRKEYESKIKPQTAIVDSYATFEAIKSGDQQLMREFETDFGLFAEAKDEETKRQILSDSQSLTDIALIFAYFKMVDPASTVREGEFATVENAGGVDTRLKNMYNKLLSGERLNDAQRQQIYRIAESKLKGAQNVIRTQQDRYSRLAERGGFDVGLLGFEDKPAVSPVGAPTSGQAPTKSVDEMSEAELDAILAG